MFHQPCMARLDVWCGNGHVSLLAPDFRKVQLSRPEGSCSQWLHVMGRPTAAQPWSAGAFAAQCREAVTLSRQSCEFCHR